METPTTAGDVQIELNQGRGMPTPTFFTVSFPLHQKYPAHHLQHFILFCFIRPDDVDIVTRFVLSCPYHLFAPIHIVAFYRRHPEKTIDLPICHRYVTEILRCGYHIARTITDLVEPEFLFVVKPVLLGTKIGLSSRSILTGNSL